MPFQLSPGVAVVEKDFTSIVPAVSTSAGAFAGAFAWGPVEDPVQIASENELVDRFGKPTENNFIPFYTAANFLSYANNLLVVRTDGTNLKNAVSSGTAVLVKNADQYASSFSSGQAAVGEFAAKYPGVLGNSLQVIAVDKDSWSAFETAQPAIAAQFEFTPDTSPFAKNAGKTTAEDELHVIIIDKNGAWSGTAGTVLEKFVGLSKASDAKKLDGSNNYYKDVLNSQSKYIWWMDHSTAVGATGTAWGAPIASASAQYKALTAALDITLTGGVDATPSAGQVNVAFDRFENPDSTDVSLLMAGATTGVTTPNYLISIAESRKDCLVFISPDRDDVVDNFGDEATDVAAAAAALTKSSYAVMDSGYKYQYDKYNDLYRWVPLNGDIAGLCVRTDNERDPWFSPAGLNRGIIKNVVKLAWNPTKAERDSIYKAGVNPVVTFPGEGTLLYGDKTLLNRPSAFDRINVRRLFIVLEKSIAKAARSSLFEFNDEFTRAAFVNIVEPYLREVQGRRGIFDYRVICDTTNNTPEVIDQNQFVGDIYIKPARSINFIQLNFTAVRTGVEFEEIVGRV